MNISVAPKHDQDLYGWTMHTANLLKEGRIEELDFENILEEMEALGNSQKNELKNRLSLILSHLLKWQFQPTLRGHSWIYTLEEQRKQAQDLLEDSPSLKSKRDEVMQRSYEIATSKAARDTGLNGKTFPKECPYTFEQVMDQEYYPS